MLTPEVRNFRRAAYGCTGLLLILGYRVKGGVQVCQEWWCKWGKLYKEL